MQPRAAVVAVHARGGDKKVELQGHLDSEGRFLLEAGLTRLRDLIMGGTAEGSRLPGNDISITCVIVGDDLGYAEAAAQTAERILGCLASAGHVVLMTSSMSSTGHDQSRFEKLTLEERCNATRSLVLDAGETVLCTGRSELTVS